MNRITKTTAITSVLFVVAFAFVVMHFATPNGQVAGGSLVAAHSALAYGDSGCGGCGGGGGGEGSGKDQPPPPPSPSCDTFTADKTSLPAGGGDVTLTWRTSNVSGVHIAPIGAVPDDGHQTVHVTDTTTFKLWYKNGAGSTIVLCQVTVTVPPPSNPASCDAFTANPVTLPSGGGDVQLAWNTTNAQSVSIDNGIGNVRLNGSRTVHVTHTTTFTLTAIGTGGNDTCTVTVTVPPPSNEASCDSFTAVPTSLPAGGGDVVLTWNTTNAQSVSIDNGVGAVSADGSKTVHVTNTTTFTLTVVGANNTDTCHVTITVGTSNVASCDSFTASPTSLPAGGGDVVLTWNTTNAQSVSIDNGVGAVSADGSKTVHVTNTTTYTLTVTGANNTADCHVTITVGSNPPGLSCDSFQSNYATVHAGDSITLTWATTGATSASIDQGIGSVPVDGSRSVTVNGNTTYTLTATDGVHTVTCTAGVQIATGGGGGGGGSSSSCDLYISDHSINRGDTVTLTWDNRRATDIILEDDHGNTLVDTKHGDSQDPQHGSLDLRPTEDTTFTLTAYRGSSKRVCKGSVNVSNNIAVYQYRQQTPLVAGISLTKVPYTGFDAGPFLTGLFYTLIAAWAFGIAYILVVKRGSVFGFALAKPAQVLTDTPVPTHVPHQLTKPEPIVPSVPAQQAAYSMPTDLPVAVGYASIQNDTEASVPEVVAEPAGTFENDDARVVEEYAHSKHVLLSNDVISSVISHSPWRSEQQDFLDEVIAKAKTTLPSEDGWTVVNAHRFATLLA